MWRGDRWSVGAASRPQAALFVRPSAKRREDGLLESPLLLGTWSPFRACKPGLSFVRSFGPRVNLRTIFAANSGSCVQRSKVHSGPTGVDVAPEGATLSSSRCQAEGDIASAATLVGSGDGSRRLGPFAYPMLARRARPGRGRSSSRRTRHSVHVPSRRFAERPKRFAARQRRQHQHHARPRARCASYCSIESPSRAAASARMAWADRAIFHSYCRTKSSSAVRPSPHETTTVSSCNSEGGTRSQVPVSSKQNVVS